MSKAQLQRVTRAIRLPEVRRLAGLGRDSVYRLCRQGRFPKPFKLSERASAWNERDVLEWLQQRASAIQA